MSICLSHLSEIVEVVLLVHPVITQAFVDAIDLGNDVIYGRALAVVHHAFEQLTHVSDTSNNIMIYRQTSALLYLKNSWIMIIDSL